MFPITVVEKHFFKYYVKFADVKVSNILLYYEIYYYIRYLYLRK